MKRKTLSVDEDVKNKMKGLIIQEFAEVWLPQIQKMQGYDDALNRLRALLPQIFGDVYNVYVRSVRPTTAMLQGQLNGLYIQQVSSEDFMNLLSVFLTIIKGKMVTKFFNFEKIGQQLGLEAKRVNKIFLEDFYRFINPLPEQAKAVIALICKPYYGQTKEVPQLTEICYNHLRDKLQTAFCRQQVNDQVRQQLKAKKVRQGREIEFKDEEREELKQIIEAMEKNIM